MAKFAIYMPTNGEVVAKVVLEAKQIFIYASAKKTTLTDENDDIISVIPPGALVYKVAEPEKTAWAVGSFQVSQAQIEELKQALVTQEEIIAAKTDTIERLNMEIEGLKKMLDESEAKVKCFAEKMGEAFEAVLKEVK